jgi:hypothetical protein
MSYGLDRIRWNNEGETMSHPPETSLSSRELAKQVYYIAENPPRPWSVRRERDEYCVQDIQALIDAWVRVREAEAKLASVRWFLDQTSVDSRGEAQMIAYPEIANLEAALATARKQLKGEPT